MALKQPAENLLWLHSDLDDAGLDPFTFRIYAHLARRAESTGKAWPRMSEIAAHCGISERMVRESIKKLVDERLIVIVGGTGFNGGGKRNVYHLVARNAWLNARLNPQPAQDAGCEKEGDNRHDMPVQPAPHAGSPILEKGNPIKGNPTKGASASFSSNSVESEAPQKPASAPQTTPAPADAPEKARKPEKRPPSATSKAKAAKVDPKKFLADFPVEFRQSDDFVEAWVRWAESRVEVGKNPVTQGAAAIARNKLVKWPIDHAVKALDAATLNGWAGVFPESLNTRAEPNLDAASGNASDQDFGLG